MTVKVRWGILGTANIAQAAFLPGLRAAGGRAAAVAGRDAERTRRYAQQHGIERVHTGYEALLDDPLVDAVYVPLPNALHLPWVLRALEAGKPVLCEKPLGLTAADVDTMIDASRKTGVPLWEAFVFMFRPHFAQIQSWIGDGAIGTLQAVDSHFCFALRTRNNIRLRPELGGGALYDVGCYPVHLATQLFGGAGLRAAVLADRDPTGVDAATSGVVAFETGHLLFRASLASGPDTFTRIVGSEGVITTSNPFHPGDGDDLTLQQRSRMTRVRAGDGTPSFTAQIAHIQRVVQGEEAARATAATTSRATAATLDLIRETAARDS